MPNLSRMLIWCAFLSVTNIQRYFGNREGICQIWPELIIICIHTHLIHNWWWKHKLKVMIRNQKIKGTFICGPLLFKWMDVFQSWLDCFSIGEWAFIQNINFLSSVVFVYWCPFVTIFKCCPIDLQSHYTFFQVHQIASDIVPILYNKQ